MSLPLRSLVVALLCACLPLPVSAAMLAHVARVDGRPALSISDPRSKLRLGPIHIEMVKDGLADPLAENTATASWGAPIAFCRTKSGRPVNVVVDDGPGRARIDVVPAQWQADEIRLTIPAREDEDFFGGGEVWNGSLNQRGKKLDMWVGEGTPDRCCYVPFYLSTRGYGLYVDSHERGSFEFCTKEHPHTVQVTFRTKDRPKLTLFFIEGPEPKSVIANYTAITGRPPLPPKWSFLPWKWRDEHRNWDQVFEDAKGMRKHDIPCSVIWIDNPWQKYGLCSFEFDPVRFPDAPERIKQLKAMGYKVVLWVAPFTNPGVPNYQVALDKGYFVKTPDGKPCNMGEGYYIDFTNPAAFAWWKEEMKKVLALGIDGFKLDRGQRIPDDAVFSDGSTGASMHNRYALLYCKACYEALDEVLHGDFTMLPRPGAAGSQVYSPGKWPGDLSPDFSPKSGLPSSIIAGLSIGLSGFPFWGSDIGGFERGGPDKVTLIRWTQFGCFSPIMELGGQDSHEPWDPRFAPEGLPVYRYYATLHSELLPYTYTYATIAHETGLPIMRPLVLEFPQDRAARNQGFEFLYGQHILVAPLHTAEDSSEVYLPAGKWTDYWDWSRTIQGPTTFKVTCPLDRMPIYLREGAIIPMEVANSVTGHGDAYSKGRLTVLFLPSGRSHFTMRDGKLSTDFWCAQEGETTRIAWKNAPKPLLLRVRARSAASVTSVSGEPYTHVAAAAYAGKPGTWCFDVSAKCVMVSPRAGDAGVTVE